MSSSCPSPLGPEDPCCLGKTEQRQVEQPTLVLEVWEPAVQQPELEAVAGCVAQVSGPCLAPMETRARKVLGSSALRWVEQTSWVGGRTGADCGARGIGDARGAPPDNWLCGTTLGVSGAFGRRATNIVR